ncbi:hypothetical protein EZS27_040473, partial [termite gut metagenome]
MFTETTDHAEHNFCITLNTYPRKQNELVSSSVSDGICPQKLSTSKIALLPNNAIIGNSFYNSFFIFLINLSNAIETQSFFHSVLNAISFESGLSIKSLILTTVGMG